MKKLLPLINAIALIGIVMNASAQLYVAGDFNGWVPDSIAMTETSAGSGIWQATISYAAGTYYQFKVETNAWSWSTPSSGNSWLYTDGSGSATITYNANTVADGWSSSLGRIGVNNDPGTWTAVGDWQSAVWVNNDPTTVMTSIGGGIYELSYVIGTAGSYNYKAVDTGSWDAIGADARSVNAANLGFTTTSANQAVNFYVDAINGTIKVDVVAVPEPSTLAICGLSGLAAFFLIRRRR